MSLLEERIQKYDIPNWMYQPVFDRVLVYQIPTVESDTFAGSSLIKPEQTKVRERSQSPRGVIVAAGQKAREILDDHGIQIGHVVWFARMALFRHEIDASRTQFSIIRAGEICGSEDLLVAVKSGAASFLKVEGQYYIADASTEAGPPTVIPAKRQDPEEWSDQ